MIEYRIRCALRALFANVPMEGDREAIIDEAAREIADAILDEVHPPGEDE